MENLLETTLWTPEQAAAFSNACTAVHEQLWLPLQVPGWQPWWTALQAAAVDSRQALASLGSFWFITLRPVVLFLSILIQTIARLVWKYVLVQGISQQGVQYLTAASKAVYRHQRSLTPRQMAIEVGAVAVVVLVYKIFKILQKQRYYQRFSTWTRLQKTRVTNSYRRSKQTVVQFYDRTVQSIASTSVLLAVMTPHMIFGVGAVALKTVMPRLVTFLACETACVQVLKSWYPLAATILLLNGKKHVRGKKAKAQFKESEAYWLSFWMVRAACQASQELLFLLPFLRRYGVGSLKQLEFFFYLWIFIMPSMIPDLADAPETRPHAQLAPLAQKAAAALYRSMDVFTDAFWQAYPVRWTTFFLDVAVLARVVITRETADTLRALVAGAKSYLLPASTLLFPSFVSWFGVFFVQYAVPLQYKTPNRAKREHMLRYWIFHCPLSALIASASTVLWWIPFSKIFTCAIFLKLILREGMVEGWFTELIRDLEAIGHYLGVVDENDQRQQRELHQTWIARGLQTVLENLPRAKDAEEEGDESGDDVASSDSEHPQAQEQPVPLNNARDDAPPIVERYDDNQEYAGQDDQDVGVPHDDAIPDDYNFDEPDDALNGDYYQFREEPADDSFSGGAGKENAAILNSSPEERKKETSRNSSPPEEESPKPKLRRSRRVKKKRT